MIQRRCGRDKALHPVEKCTVTAARYRVEDLEFYVCLSPGAIDNDFILMDNNARSRRVALVSRVRAPAPLMTCRVQELMRLKSAVTQIPLTEIVWKLGEGGQLRCRPHHLTVV
ncbi:hypothetical protein TNCV_1192321 [Trichonephila clavipes]|nr:hypothetical protein TNCV_1192321 [Trichonephila clavipes]